MIACGAKLRKAGSGELGVVRRVGAAGPTSGWRWRPLYEALRAAREGTPDYLRTVAPEIRVAAMDILRNLDPNLFPDGEAGA